MQGGGKNLTSMDPTFASQPIPTGGGNSDNVYVFTFTAEFPVTDVHVTFEDQDGKPVTGTSNDMDSITVKDSGGASIGTSSQGGGSDSSGKCTTTQTIAANSSFTVEVDADSNLDNVKFRISFTTPPAEKHKMIVPEVNTGHCTIDATPVTETVDSALVSVRNTSGDVVTFGRFDLVGLTGITVTAVSAPGFSSTIDSGGRGFTISGSLAVNGAVGVDITFSGETTDLGALLTRFDHD